MLPRFRPTILDLHRRPRCWLLVAVTIAGLAAVACGSDNGNEAGTTSPSIVATTSIWSDVVANVACDGQAEVSALIPTGGDPHAFEPSLADRGDLEDATLVVANGLGLEEGLGDTLDAIDTPVLVIADHIGPLTTAESSEDDPHLWFDPVRVSAALPTLAARLVADAGLDADAVAACVSDYQRRLDAVDREIADMVGALPSADPMLVTSHDALGYFADRYGFTIVGTVVGSSSSLAEATPAQLEDLALLLEREDVPAIFVDSDQSADDAEALAQRVDGVEVVVMRTGTLGPPDSGADTYVGFLRTNAALITDALT